ncbi:MAG: hypothetical protein ACF8R9_15890 [Phycisphaerales bacterium JB054]
MGRRKLVTWRRARGLVLFGGFGVLLSVGVAWGVRHWHYASGYPAVSRWFTSGESVFLSHGRGWSVAWRAGLGRWRYECRPKPVHEMQPRLDPQQMRVIAELPQFAAASTDGDPYFDGSVPRAAEELLLTVEPEQLVSARAGCGFPVVEEWSLPPGWVDRPDPSHGLSRTLTVAYGWPLPAMSEGVHFTNTLGVERVWIWTPGNRDARGLRRARPILESAEFGFPIRPVWRGLLGNAAIYGAVCWTAVGGVRWSWRRLRHKRGACVACGYDLAGLPKGSGCPECGAGTEPAE